MLGKVLIANRGEIAVRIAHACRKLGIRSVAVYSEADAASLHAEVADESYLIGPAPALASYLNVEAMLEVAKRSGADAIHPGYGFLAENPTFAQRCSERGLIFVGPDPRAMEQMGDKLIARQIAKEAGVPTVPGAPQVADLAEAEAAARVVGFPVLLKAAAGGGGIGMMRAEGPEQLGRQFEAAQRRAEQAFGDGRLYMERWLEAARHVEVQLLGAPGHLWHLHERNCSIQRRHQKVIEEAPAPGLATGIRNGLVQAALGVGRAVGYQSAGTVEFLLAPGGEFYFLEMNTRIQVEHPVTEMVTGIDLVAEQLRIAGGESPNWEQSEIARRGHAIECRIYAEDPDTLLPSPGTVTTYTEPSGPYVRVDSGIRAGSVVSPYYDPLLAKVIAWGETRQEAVGRLRDALEDMAVEGLKTNLPLHRRVLDSPTFRSGAYDVSLLGAVLAEAPQAASTIRTGGT